MHMQTSSVPALNPPTRWTARFSLPGLIGFSLALIVVTSLLTWFIVRASLAASHASSASMSLDDAPRPAKVPQWGELMERDILLDRPDEYVAFELDQSRRMEWVFTGKTPAQVRATMQLCGLPETLIDHALSPDLASAVDGDLLIKPDAKLLESLSPAAREQLYGELANDPKNFYMAEPFSFSTQKFFALLQAGDLAPKTVAIIERLSYPRGERTYFSDIGFLLGQLSDDTERLKVLKTLSRIPAVLVRLRVRPDSDIDKLVSYWASAPGVRTKDVRPLLESVQRLEGGGTIGISFLLPPFARERLYTFPRSTRAGEAEVDCHWSAMNFFNKTPDDRFLDLAYTSSYIEQNYYPIAAATAYGDLVFVLDAKGGVIHSAVHIAGDLVFTKNGKSFGQPWLLMHLSDLISLYSSGPPSKIMYYRSNNS